MSRLIFYISSYSKVFIQRGKVAVRFYHHPDFEKELAKFIKKHCQNNTTPDTVFRHIQNLLTSYFEHNNPVFPNLSRGEGFKGHEVYFHRFIVPTFNLGKTQHTKCYIENLETDHALLEPFTTTPGVMPKSTEYNKQGHLIKLDLSVLHITQLPEEIGQLTPFQSLSLENNQLTNISPEIAQVRKLQHLY